MNILVFDIETIPDVDVGRRIYGLEGMDDTSVAEAMYAKRRADNNGGGDFLRHHLHRVAAISVLLRHDTDKLRVDSLGDPDSSERELVSRFFDLLGRYKNPTLVSWNGSGFDLPVLHYRALKHSVVAASYWDQGEKDQAFRWNNYINRYHMRHTDMMDLFALYQSRAYAPLDDVAILLGLPGKMGIGGNKVWESYQAGDIVGIRNYCEVDVLNTYLIYLRFELMRGHLDAEDHQRECQRLHNYLAANNHPHLREFLSAWDEASG
ncbi:3'-5' exonuclease [Gammaproteobacteria bacterium]